MSTTYLQAARARSVVQLTDGRYGRLVYWPTDRPHGRKRSTGGRAKVLIGGRHELVTPDQVAAIVG